MSNEGHIHVCDCETCMNRGGGVRLEQLNPRLPSPTRQDYHAAQRALPSRRDPVKKRLQNQRSYMNRKLKAARAAT